MLNDDDQTVMLCLSMTLREVCRSFSDQQQSQVAHVVMDFIDQIKVDQAAGLTPAQVSASLHEAGDQFLAEGKSTSPNGTDIRCTDGCAHCCHIAVAVTSCEAEELLEVAQAKGLVIDQAKLARQAQQTDETWLSMSTEDRRCVFLGSDNRCQIYEHRPFSCRKYFSVDPPELCNIDRYPKQQVQVWFDLWTEALTTAAFTHFGTGFLSHMLLDATQRKEESRDHL